jgi:hypothetical protein
MKSLPLALLILISASPHPHSQTPPQVANTAFQAQAGFRLQILPSGEKILVWAGRPGFTYFIQASPDLVDWTRAPNIEPGVNGPMSYQIGGPTACGFFRLTGTAQTAAALDTTDFDGDGLSNLYEITPRPRPGNLTGFAGLKPNIQTSPVEETPTTTASATSGSKTTTSTQPTTAPATFKTAPMATLTPTGLTISANKKTTPIPKTQPISRSDSSGSPKVATAVRVTTRPQAMSTWDRFIGMPTG